MTLLTTSPWLHERSWTSVEAYLERNDIILVPVGATEQHGPHAPLMLDTGWAIGVSEEVARRTNTLAAPALHYGWSSGHMAFAGAVTLTSETLTTVLVEICRSLMVHGFKKFVLVNGNRVANLPPMEIAAIKLRVHHGALAAVLDVGLIARREVGDIVGTHAAGVGHAGDAETSYMIHHREDLVDMSKAPVGPGGGLENETDPARAFINLVGPHDRNLVQLKPTPEQFAESTRGSSGVVGDAAAATRDKGERIFEAIVDNAVAFIETIRDERVTVRNVEIPI